MSPAERRRRFIGVAATLVLVGIASSVTTLRDIGSVVTVGALLALLALLHRLGRSGPDAPASPG